MKKGKKWLAAALSAAMIAQSLANIGPVYAADGVSISDTFTDTSFRSYVSANFDDGDGYLSDSEIADVTSIDVSKCSPAISSMKGIEIFGNLTRLDCNEQSIRNLDIENLSNLEYIDVSSNRIDSLTLPVSADHLTYLDISDNKITNLTSLSDYNNLILLNASSTNLSSIDVSGMKGLVMLGVSGTTISSLDLSSNMELLYLYCEGMSSLSTLNLSDHKKIKNVYCGGVSDVIKSSLTKIDVSGDSSLTSLDCSNSNVSELIIDGTDSLSVLNCSNSKITSIDVSKNTKLTDLNVSGNVLGEINLVSNTLIEKLNVNNTGISELNVENLTSLTSLDAGNNSIAYIDISKNASLATLELSNNNLQSIDLKNNHNLSELHLDNNSLVCVDISSCSALFNNMGNFSCNGNSRDIVLEEPNFDYDLGDFSNKYGLHKIWDDTEIIGDTESGEQNQGRTETTVGYAGIQGIDSNNKKSTIKGGELDGYTFTADPDAVKFEYNYYVGYGKTNVKFTLNIQNPLKIVVWYSTEDGVTKSDQSTLNFKVGDETTLTAKDDDGNVHDNITWSSSNEKVAIVDSKTGKLQCVAAGTAQIHVILNGRSVGYINMECHKPVTGMYLVDQTLKDDNDQQIVYEDGSVIDMDYGTYATNASKQIDVKCLTEDGLAGTDISGFTCKITDADGNESNKVAVFNSTRKTITTRGSGIAFLHFISEDNKDVEIVVQLNVKQRVNSVSLSKTKVTMISGDTGSLTASVAPNTAADQEVEWSSSDSSIVSVDQEGILTAKAVGEADITCTSKDSANAYARCHIVVQAPVQGLSLNITEKELLLGATSDDRTVSLEALIDAEDISIYNLSWSTSNSNIATVSVDTSDKTKAIVTARNPGEAVIKFALSDNKYVTCKITVKQRVTSLRINKDKSILYIGDTMNVTCSISPDTANNKNIVWNSSDKSVATIDENGLITAVGKGTTVISATALDGSDRSTSFSLTVKKYVSSVSLDTEAMTLYVGERGTVKATVLPEDANDRGVIWQSSDPAVASVSSGSIYGNKAGTATITCTSRDGSNILATCKVTVVQQISTITFTETVKTVNVGKKFTVNAAIAPETAENKEVIWTSSNKDVATVTQDGIVTAVARGTVNIVCEAVNGISGKKAKATLRLTVNQPVTGIKLSTSKATLFLGKTLRITSTVSPTNANNRSVEWVSSNPKVATVAGGTVTAVAKGTTVISCKALDGSGIISKCTVTVAQPVTKIRLNTYKATLIYGRTCTLRYVVAPSTASNKAVVWSSSNKKIATVTQTGVVKAVGKGTAVITCKAKDGSGVVAQCTVTTVIRVSSVKLNKRSISIKKGGRYTLKATVGPASASNKSVAWKSSNTKIATVSSTGVVVGKAKGKVVITCKAKDGSGKYAKCIVVVK